MAKETPKASTTDETSEANRPAPQDENRSRERKTPAAPPSGDDSQDSAWLSNAVLRALRSRIP